MSRSIALATIFLATALLCTSACKTNIYTSATEGRCAWVNKGATAPADGVFLTAGKMSDVKAGDTAPTSGVAMYHCGMATKGAAAPAEALFYANQGSAPQSFSKGSPAPSDGVACDASKCSSASITVGMKATADGTFLADGAAGAVKKGETAGESGFFCEGCVLADTGATAPTAGKIWQYPHAAGTAVAACAKNTGSAGMFCPAASGSSSSGSSSSSTSGASATAATGGSTTGTTSSSSSSSTAATGGSTSPGTTTTGSTSGSTTTTGGTTKKASSMATKWAAPSIISLLAALFVTA